MSVDNIFDVDIRRVRQITVNVRNPYLKPHRLLLTYFETGLVFHAQGFEPKSGCMSKT